jgi:hypothetical protein
MKKIATIVLTFVNSIYDWLYSRVGAGAVDRAALEISSEPYEDDAAQHHCSLCHAQNKSLSTFFGAVLLLLNIFCQTKSTHPVTQYVQYRYTVPVLFLHKNFVLEL